MNDGSVFLVVKRKSVLTHARVHARAREIRRVLIRRARRAAAYSLAAHSRYFR
jgi:hypothetical protein